MGQKRKIMFILTGISAIIGVMLATQLQSNLKPKTTESRDVSELRTVLQAEVDKHKRLLDDISKYRQLYYQYQNALNNGKSAEVMQEELLRTRRLAGLASIEGPGVLIKIVDTPTFDSRLVNPDDQNRVGLPVIVPTLVIDQDLRSIVNELFYNEAKAISINGHRITATTPIRNVGEHILVDEHIVQPPYEIKAIGDPDILISSIKLAGIDTELQLSNKTILYEKYENLYIPASRKERTIQYMKPVLKKGDS